MASQFDRWEKDPFFSAAEEVQESADRMESTYRTWIHSMKDSGSLWNSDELRRDLRTALGTTKWQLEEFERAVSLSYTNSPDDDAKGRHREFAIAIGSRISKVETSLNESAVLQGRPPLPWVRLDEGESDELALFLSGSSTFSSGNNKISGMVVDGVEQQIAHLQDADKQPELKCPLHSNDGSQVQTKEEKFPGHRRTASAGAGIGSCKILVSEDAFPQSLSNVQADPPPRKIPSFSGFLNTMESAAKLNWSKNGYRKLKLSDHHPEDSQLPRTQPLTRGNTSCYERSKSFLDGCDECYDKQLYGWYGAIQRQLQRSQYHMQYSRPVQFVFSTVILLCVIVLLALR